MAASDAAKGDPAKRRGPRVRRDPASARAAIKKCFAASAFQKSGKRKHGLITQLAREYDLAITTLAEWVKPYKSSDEALRAYDNKRTPGAPKKVPGTAWTPNNRTLCARLKPGQNLKEEVCATVNKSGVQSAWVTTCVGTLNGAKLRLAGSAPGNERFMMVQGPVEIVSLAGTISSCGDAHLHIALAKPDGTVVGGQLVGDDAVATTAELVLGAGDGMRFARELDEATGQKELVVRKLRGSYKPRKPKDKDAAAKKAKDAPAVPAVPGTDAFVGSVGFSG